MKGLRCAALAALACGGATVGAAETKVMSYVYVCERGVSLPVSFVNPPEGAGLAFMVVQDRLVAMRAAPTGSGVRYVALDEQVGYRLYTKGSEAFVRFLAADHTAEEEPVLDGCVMGPDGAE